MAKTNNQAQNKKTGDEANNKPSEDLPGGKMITGKDQDVTEIEGPKSDKDADMKAFMEQILAAQKKQAEEFRALKKENEELRKRVSTEDLDPSKVDQNTIDDYEEKPVVFFAYSHRPSMFSYRLKGKNLLPPNGPIRFKEHYRYTSGSSFEKRVHTISQHVSHSKREIEYIRNSPEYNVRYFENMAGATRYDHSYADVLGKESSKVSMMTDHAVIQAVTNEPRLSVKADIDSMRKELIQLRADDAMKNRKRLENLAAQETQKSLKELEGTNFTEKVTELQRQQGLLNQG